MKKSIKNLQFILTCYTILNVLYLLVSSYLWRHSKIYFKTYSNGFIVLLVINILLIIYLLIKNKYKKNIIDLYLILCVLFAVIATIFAFNKEVSLFGMYNRYEGLLQICYYMTILFISSYIEEKNKKYIIYTMLFTGVIEVFYGFMQVMNYYSFFEIRNMGTKLASGMITNSNFYGTYMLICLSYSVGLFLDDKGNNKSAIYFLLFLVFMIGLLISNALSSIVGFICVLIYIFIYCVVNKKYSKYLFVLFIFISTTVGLTFADMTFAISDLIKTKNEIVEISKGNFDDNFGTDRMYVWKNTMKIVPENLINGVGVDNFYYAFDGKPLGIYDGKIVYDKVHNEYLQTLVTQGIFALISYLFLYITISIKGIKDCFKEKKLYLILPVGGYLVQAFFNISVIEVAPLFYISLGLLMQRDNKIKE